MFVYSKKQDSRRVKNADGQIEDNSASTPVLFSPWLNLVDYAKGAL